MIKDNSNQYTEQTIVQILDMKANGLSSRDIASALGVSKSGVNDLYKRITTKPVNAEGAKILLYDLETSAAEVYVFGRFKQYVNDKAIKKEGGRILCFSYKWLGSGTVSSFQMTEQEIANNDDSRLVAELIDLYSQADAVVAYNLQGYDDRVSQTRALANGYGALPTVKKLDPFLQAKKKLKLPSNSMNNVAAYFGLELKNSTNMELWVKVQQGDKAAMKEMVDYCEQDVNVLEQVYYLLQPLGNVKTDFNASLYYNDNLIRCRTCGSSEINPTGKTVTTSLSLFDEYKCSNCGAIHRNRTSTTTKEKRKSLLQ